MFGPEIITRSISTTRIFDHFGNEWQYHPQSDRHSKVTCWAVLFDLLRNCPLLVQHIEAGKVGFGINHELRDFQTGRKKDLDLVICSPGGGPQITSKFGKSKGEFTSLALSYGIKLHPDEQLALSALPVFRTCSVGSVYVALESKAAMTEHVKALPRLHDELDSSHSTVHGHADNAIAVATVLINSSQTFLSPNRNKFDLSTQAPVVNPHTQPKAVARTLEKIREIRRRSGTQHQGFDAVGIIIIDFPNSGVPCEVVREPPAPKYDEPDNYEQMIRRIATLYASKFGAI